MFVSPRNSRPLHLRKIQSLLLALLLAVRSRLAKFSICWPPDARPEEPILLGQSPDGVIPLNKVNDYVFRPASFASWSLYDFLRRTDVRKLRANEPFLAPALADIHMGAHQFVEGHPLRSTHGTYIRDEGEAYILNFVGQVLPRPDKGDYESYCSTMLVFFSPLGWRSGRDLLGHHNTFVEAFAAASFSSAHLVVMKNMNVLYECLDARDDYAALRRSAGRSSTSTLPIHGSFTHKTTRSTEATFWLEDLEFTDKKVAQLAESGDVGRKTALHRQIS
ncbi:hypothetical protein C8Q78DRAFT_1113372, partial [Trametes maxima]